MVWSLFYLSSVFCNLGIWLKAGCLDSLYNQVKKRINSEEYIYRYLGQTGSEF